MLTRKYGPWDYKMMPNKMLQLVKNVGNMRQEETGFYLNDELEMLKVLAYLNYGEKTNLTLGMKSQIDTIVRRLEWKQKMQEQNKNR